METNVQIQETVPLLKPKDNQNKIITDLDLIHGEGIKDQHHEAEGRSQGHCQGEDLAKDLLQKIPSKRSS